MGNLLLPYSQAASFWGPMEFSLLSIPVPNFLHLRSVSAFLPFNQPSVGGLSSMVSQSTLVSFHSTFFLVPNFGRWMPRVTQVYLSLLCYHDPSLQKMAALNLGESSAGFSLSYPSMSPVCSILPTHFTKVHWKLLTSRYIPTFGESPQDTSLTCHVAKKNVC